MRRVEVTDWKTGEKREGLFHAFGLDVAESSDGNASYSVVIVESADGLIEMVACQYVRFLDPPEVAA